MARKRNKKPLHPIMTYIVLICVIIVLSGILGLLDVSTNYNVINAIRGNIESTTAAVKSLFNLSGLKTIFSSTVANFASFAPLSMLIITLIGIGIMDKSGFLQSFFTLLTKKADKFRVTFILALLLVFASIAGDIMFIVLIPITALFFKYSKRNPKAGVVMAFAALTVGTSINVFMNSVDSALLSYTLLAANSIDSSYEISVFCNLFIMIALTFIMALLISSVTEKIIIPRMEKYEEENEEEFYLDKRKKRGLLFSLTIGFLYLLIFIYNIIPGLPFSGNLLDYSQTYYIDKLFGYNSFFNQGFVFVITFFFFLLGFFYGLGAKTIKNNQDVSNYLGHSLDGIGKTLVLIFFASAFISIYKESNIGNVIAASAANLIGSSGFTGIPLIILSFVVVMVVTIFVPSTISSWSILSGVMVPTFINAGMTPEFASLLFRLSASVTYGLTPVMAYFVIYLAFLNMYSEDEKPEKITSSIKHIIPYAGYAAVIYIVILILLYVIGIPFGIGATATI